MIQRLCVREPVGRMQQNLSVLLLVCVYECLAIPVSVCVCLSITLPYWEPGGDNLQDGFLPRYTITLKVLFQSCHAKICICEFIRGKTERLSTSRDEVPCLCHYSQFCMHMRRMILACVTAYVQEISSQCRAAPSDMESNVLGFLSAVHGLRSGRPERKGEEHTRSMFPAWEACSHRCCTHVEE